MLAAVLHVQRHGDSDGDLEKERVEEMGHRPRDSMEDVAGDAVEAGCSSRSRWRRDSVSGRSVALPAPSEAARPGAVQRAAGRGRPGWDWMRFTRRRSMFRA